MKIRIFTVLLIFTAGLVFSSDKKDANNMIKVELIKITNIDELDTDNLKSMANYKEKTAVFSSGDIIKYDKKLKLLTIKKISLNKLYRKPLLIALNKDLTIGCFDTILYSSVNTMQYKCKIIFWDYSDMTVQKNADEEQTVLKIDFKDKAFEEKWNKLIKK